MTDNQRIAEIAGWRWLKADECQNVPECRDVAHWHEGTSKYAYDTPPDFEVPENLHLLFELAITLGLLAIEGHKDKDWSVLLSTTSETQPLIAKYDPDLSKALIAAILEA